MNVFEKIKEKLEELKSNKGFGGTIQTMYADAKIDKAISIVDEVAKEYNNGWIPCSKRLPSEVDYENVLYIDNDGDVDVCCTDWFLSYSDTMLAWQPLPAPYKEGGTE